MGGPTAGFEEPPYHGELQPRPARQTEGFLYRFDDGCALPYLDQNVLLIGPQRNTNRVARHALFRLLGRLGQCARAREIACVYQDNTEASEAILEMPSLRTRSMR